jgi:hypothetical protein
VISTWQGSEILTVDRALTDISTIKISDLHHFPSGQKSPLKNGLSIKMSIFRADFYQEIPPFES